MKRKLTWLAGWFCTALALGFVLWLRADGERNGGVASEGSGSRVTKPYPRDRDARERRTKNPREEFEAARKRGLTEEEVRVIVEEYIAAVAFEDQPNRPVEEVLNDLSVKRFEFYIKSLTEGFKLSEEQREAVQSKLPSLVEHNIQCSLLMLVVFNQRRIEEAGDASSNESPALTRLEQIEAITNYPLFSHGDDFSPWKLIELSDSQKEMIGYLDDAGEWVWVDGKNRTFDHGMTDCYGDLSDPFAAEISVMEKAGEIFPLSMWQVEQLGDFEDESVSPHTPRLKIGNDLDRVKFLTRPQLKTLLLFNPEMAVRLIEELGE